MLNVPPAPPRVNPVFRCSFRTRKLEVQSSVYTHASSPHSRSAGRFRHPRQSPRAPLLSPPSHRGRHGYCCHHLLFFLFQELRTGTVCIFHIWLLLLVVGLLRCPQRPVRQQPPVAAEDASCPQDASCSLSFHCCWASRLLSLCGADKQAAESCVDICHGGRCRGVGLLGHV